MARFTRRKFLQASGAGLAGILASHQAPVFAQAGTVHWIKWNDFVPASDELLRKTILPEAGKALGLKIDLETVNGNDLQPRATSPRRSARRRAGITSSAATTPTTARSSCRCRGRSSAA